MEHKQRNKIMLVLTALSVPLLIYLLTANIANIRGKPSPQEPAAINAPGPEVVPPGAEVHLPKRTATVDTNLLAEQKRIATLLPENNPFNPSRPIIADPPPITTTPATTAPPAAPDTGIKLTAIVSRQGSATRMAMINGRLHVEGDHIAGWTIIKITNRDVLLEDGGRQMVLKLK